MPATILKVYKINKTKSDKVFRVNALSFYVGFIYGTRFTFTLRDSVRKTQYFTFENGQFMYSTSSGYNRFFSLSGEFLNCLYDISDLFQVLFEELYRASLKYWNTSIN